MVRDSWFGRSRRGGTRRRPGKRLPSGRASLWLEPLEARTLLTVPTHLVIGQQPSAVVAGQTISPAVTVYVEDQFNNIVPTSTLPITVALGNNPGGGTLSGTTTQTAQNGIATFPDLSINRSGTGYTLVATAPVAPQVLPVVGVTFAGMTGNEIEVRSFSWGGSGPTGAGQPTFNDFSLTIDPSAAGPGLVYALVNGTTFSSVTIHVRTAGTDRQEYLAYTLTNALVSSYHTNPSDQTPLDTFSLRYAKVREDYRPIKPDGTLGTAVTATWDLAMALYNGPALNTLPPEDTAPTVGVSFGNANANQVTVTGFSWAAQNTGGGNPNPTDFQLRINPHSLEPSAFLAVATHSVLSSVVLHVLQPGGMHLEYLTYTFTNVVVSGFSTAESGGGAPQDTITLALTYTVGGVSRGGQVREDYRPIKADGSLGTAVTTTWDLVRDTFTGPALNTLPPEDTAPTVGVSFGNASTNEVAVTAFSWGALNNGSGNASPSGFQLTINPHSLEPSAFLAVANFTVFPTVVLHVRQPGGSHLEYLTYTFNNVVVSSFGTAESGGGAPQDTIALALTYPIGGVPRGGRVREDYRPLNPDGTLGTAVTFTWDLATNTFTGGAIVGTPAPSFRITSNPFAVTPGAASTLTVAGFPSPITAGNVSMVQVTAYDRFGNVATGYRGTVNFTSSDGQAMLPANYTFQPADQGVQTFRVTLETAGTRSITAADTMTPTITGTQSGIVVNPAAASVLRVGGYPSPVTAGTTQFVTVTAQDAYGNTATGYTGMVTFSSSDGQASLPADYTFQPADNGSKSFPAALATAGPQSLTATDTALPTLSGTQAGIVVTPAAPDHFLVTTSVGSTVAGTPFDVTVTVQDQFNNTVTGYTGTVHFSSGDPFGASLPADYIFQPADQGTATFPGGATLYTAGTWDVTATDTATGVTGSTFVAVTAAPAVAFQIGAPASAASDQAFDVTVIAVDPYGNTDMNYQGTIHFTTSDTDPGVVLPPDYTFQPGDQGMVTFSGGVILITPGDQVITATDTADPTVTGSATVTVSSPGPDLRRQLPHRSAQAQLEATRADRLFAELASLGSPNHDRRAAASRWELDWLWEQESALAGMT